MKNFILLFVSFFPVIAFSYEAHEYIVKEFIRQEQSSETISDPPEFMRRIKIPNLDEVIPKYMQKILRSNPVQVYPSFEGLKGKDLRYRDTPVTTQLGARCSAYGLTASIENLLGAPQVAKLSESHLWSKYRQFSSVSAVEAAKRMMITEYASWPRERKSPLPGWEAKTHTGLTHISYIADNVLNAVNTLDEGRPVYLGMSVTHSMKSCVSVLDPESADNGGGHAVTISGYGIDKRVPGGGYFIIKNSWGPDCGDKGYQYMPFNYCIRRGSSYCIMWDLQAVKTAFPDVPSIEPEIPEFDMKKMNVRIYYNRPWYSSFRKVVIEVDGNSLHARQIKEISFSLDNGPFSKPFVNDVDKVTMYFSTKSESHNIALKILLNNGKTVENVQRWSIGN